MKNLEGQLSSNDRQFLDHKFSSFNTRAAIVDSLLLMLAVLLVLYYGSGSDEELQQNHQALVLGFLCLTFFWPFVSVFQLHLRLRKKGLVSDKALIRDLGNKLRIGIGAGATIGFVVYFYFLL